MEPEGSLPHSQKPATCPYPEPARSYPYPPHPTSYRSILILSSHVRLGLPSGLFPPGFPAKTLHKPLLSPHTRYMPRLSHSSRFDHPNHIGWGEPIIHLFIPPIPCYLALLGPNIFLSIPFANTLSLRSSLNVSDQVSHPYNTRGKIIVL